MLLERSSATTFICGVPPSACACAAVSAVIVRTTSAAEAFCRPTTSMSASLAWSMRWMMRSIRFTLLARSEMIRMFADG